MFNPSFAKLLNKTFYKYIQPLLFYFWLVIQFKITRIIKEMHGTKSIDNNQFIVKNADKFLRRDILETYFCSRLPQLNWPLTLEELLGETCLPPPSVILFLTTLLKSLKHDCHRLHPYVCKLHKKVTFFIWKWGNKKSLAYLILASAKNRIFYKS